ncbi:hypothetical protein Tco_1403427 [Tanacetum coccineum]
MGTKVTSSSGSVLEEPEIQKLQMQAKNLKENSLNKLNALKTTIQHLSSSNHSMYYEFREAFHRLFDANEGLFRSVLSRNMQNLEMQFSNETLHEKDSNSELRAIKGQFEHFIHSKIQLQISTVHGFTRLNHRFTSSGDETSSRIVFNEEIEKKELNTLRFMAKIQDNERVAFANLIANLTLDTEENKTILKQLKKANASLTQETRGVKLTNRCETSRASREIPYDTYDPANRFCPNREETVTLEKESRSKLVKTMHSPNPTAKVMEVLIKTLLMPLSDKTILDSHCFVHKLKTEMHDDLEYVKSLEKDIDELESEKADFSNIYDLLHEECVSKDVTCSYLHSLSDLNANTELQCLYLHKVKECECLALKLSKQTESVNNEVHN